MPKPLILLVDDDPWLLKLVSATIPTSIYTVKVASDGEEAIKRARDEKPSLILLDVNIPKLNGLEVCRALRSSQETAEIPIVILSGKSDPEDIQMGKEAGCQAYLTKPFSPLELLRTIESFLDPHESHGKGR